MAVETPVGTEMERVEESRAAQIATRKSPATTGGVGPSVAETVIPGVAVVAGGGVSRSTTPASSGSTDANRLTDRERRPAKNVNFLFLFLGLLLGIPKEARRAVLEGLV